MILQSVLLTLAVSFAYASPQTSDLPTEGPYPGRCPKRMGYHVSEGYYTLWKCEGVVDGYSLRNRGGNPIVPPKEPMKMHPERKIGVDFPGRHRQELHLKVVDLPSAEGPDMRISKLYFFPRRVVPSLKALSEGRFELTLPTGEKAYFKPYSWEVSGGVLSEDPMDLPAYAKDPELFAGIHYHGTGVLLRIDRRGPASFHDGLAQVTKLCDGKICGACEVPSRHVFLKTTSQLRFATDEAFEAYLMSACGLTLD